MTRQELINLIREKQSFLCVGLDPDLEKMPSSLNGDLFAFNRAIIDATAQHAVAFKPNLAFYELLGAKGIEYFEKTVEYIKSNYPRMMIIADAKRGDIGNTSRMYARAFFEKLGVDAVTVAPYMGEDSITPFLGYEGKWIIVLVLTSNKGSSDFQQIADANGTHLFEQVLTKTQQWATKDQLMFVVGATQAKLMKHVRQLAPDHFLLVPGVGAQGGSLEEVAEYGMNKDCGLIVNSSRGIIHASNGDDFAIVAAQKASEMQQKMAAVLKQVFQ